MRLTAASLRARLAEQAGFTMIIAMGAMVVTSMLIAAVLLAVQSDATISGRDLNDKRAYYAAQAGLNAYLYHLNEDSSYWQTCSNDVQALGTVPGSTTGEQYSYQPIYNSGYSASNCSTNPISALIDDATGTIRMEFFGYAGSPQVSRGIVASFRKNSPLDFLWYTVYEALDSSISGFSGCNVFYRNGRNANCNISWVNGDTMNGPMYTEDQYLIGGTASFGRSSADQIESAAPGNTPSNICSGNSCGSLSLVGTAVPNAGTIAPPSDNSSLLTDATDYGVVYNGATTITLSGGTATVVNCPSPTASGACTTTSLNLSTDPIIYVSNANGCTTAAYTPLGVTYPLNSSNDYYGCAGDVYIQGNYTAPLTVAAADDIVIDGALTTTSSGGAPSGAATLGLVANEFVRVMHQMGGSTNSSCTSGTTNVNPLTNETIDAAILALQHSFIVDNYSCGSPMGTLTANGAIAQYFRGTVGTHSNGVVVSGYVKSYTYDDRLKYILPPYLFDIATAGWHVGRENLCVIGGTTSTTQC